jgi:hypothetical protein
LRQSSMNELSGQLCDRRNKQKKDRDLRIHHVTARGAAASVTVNIFRTEAVLSTNLS